MACQQGFRLGRPFGRGRGFGLGFGFIAMGITSYSVVYVKTAAVDSFDSPLSTTRS